MGMSRIPIVCYALICNFIFIDPAIAADPMAQGILKHLPGGEQLTQETLLSLAEKYEKMIPDKKVEIRIKRLGFENVSELRNVTVGTPFPIYFVRLDTLRNYQTSSDPLKLLIKTRACIFPLKVYDQVRSSSTVTLAKNGNCDDPALNVNQLGSPTLIKVLTKFRQKFSCQCFVVWIPAMRRYLLGENMEGLFKIIVLDDGPEKLRRGNFLPAKEVFSILSREAKYPEYDLPLH